MKRWLAVLALGCSTSSSPAPTDSTETAIAPRRDAGSAPPAADAAYDATLPWPCPCPPAGNEPPHHAR